MASCYEYHKVLTNGVGKCSRPMYTAFGGECFCDAPAYGRQEEGQTRSGEWSHAHRRWFPSYVPFLACYDHGGPKAPVDVPVDSAKASK